MKKLMSFLVLVGLLFVVYYKQDVIVNYLVQTFINNQKTIMYENNSYTKNSDLFIYEETDDFVVKDKKDILNVFYTALNGGWEDITFYCHTSYENCIEDFLALSQDQNGFNAVNNVVHPFNSYQQLLINYNSFGKVTIEIHYLYSKEEIATLQNIVDTIQKENITDAMSVEEKIKTIHDYIINHTKYDKESSQNVLQNKPVLHNANKANGPLVEGLAICGGYTDAMALFLNEFGIENYKLNSAKHIWNYVYFNNKWVHLDLTWDDPVVTPPQDMLLHSFFLIDEETLLDLDTTEHTYTNASLKQAE